MPTALEYRLLQVARKQAGLDEEQYRMVLRNVAGVESAKSLSQADLENVLAVFEDGGFRHAGKPGDYWRMKVATRGSLCGARVVNKILALVGGVPYDLAGLCRRVSGERVSRVDKLTRQAAGQKGGILAAEAAGGSPEPRVKAGTTSETSPESAGV